MQRYPAEYERTINIWQASILGENTVVRELLADGEDVEAVCRDDRAEMDGRTALSFAATYDNLETVELLLEHGADANARSAGDQRTVLMAAAGSGHVTVAETLVMAGADVNATSARGMTALMFAAAFGWPAVVRHLLRHGALLATMDRNGHDAVWWARECVEDHELGSSETLAEGESRARETLRIMELRVRWLCGMHKLLRIAPLVGRWSKYLRSLYEEVHFRPGGIGEKRCRAEFEALRGGDSENS